MKKVLLIFSVLVMCTGCATIMSGSRQDVFFSSAPSGATVFDNGVPLGVTPFAARLARNTVHPITIQLPGFQPFHILIRQTFNGWYLGNLFFGGIIGLIIDPITGAIYNLTPDQIFANFAFQTTAPSGPFVKDKSKGEIFMAVTLCKSDEWQQVGMMERAVE